MPLIASSVPELIRLVGGPRVFLADGRSAIVSYLLPMAMVGVRLADGQVIEVSRASVTSAIGPLPSLPVEGIRAVVATWRARGLDVRRLARVLSRAIESDIAHGADEAEGRAMLEALAAVRA